MWVDIVCIVLVSIIAFFTMSYYTGKAYLRGFQDATAAFTLAVSNIVIPVDITQKDGIFFVYSASGDFITQADTMEKIQENLSRDKKKAYIISKLLPES